MENYNLRADEVVLYKGNVILKSKKGTTELILTNLNIVFINKYKELFSKEEVTVLEYPVGSIKIYEDTGVIGGLQNYTMQLILQNGNAASVPGYYIYKMGIEYSEMGYACAMGMVMFLVILALTLVNNLLLKNKEDV